MRGWIGLAAVTLVCGCQSPQVLRDNAEVHAQLAQAAASHGDYESARKQQAKAQRLYESAAVRAWLTRQPVPPPPDTPPVTPVSQW
jgi:hypothetical protein